MEEHQRPAHYNRLLRLLPPDELAIVMPMLTFKRWQLDETIYDLNARLHCVYFPLTAVSSNIVMMESGAAVETSTVGREGIVGAHAALGSEHVATKTLCQVPGQVASMEIDDFRRSLEVLPRFRYFTGRFNVFFINVVSQTAACNRLHRVEERLARWLLMTHDRVLGETLPLTQELLSIMLGVNRPAVTIAAGALQEAGLITLGRGLITIESRPGLESASCECYAVVNRELDRLLPDTVEIRLAPEEVPEEASV
ncbi:MAG: Crp/Fnr family transcriptional regulator [Candidatus Eremiobacteraeota bacterium]|nr:Crp/Fnr family transcriptional regulator [Candidatus Eremiobacteraeota bacterium]